MINKIFEDKDDRIKVIAGTIMIFIALVIAIVNRGITKTQTNSIENDFELYARTYYEKGFYNVFLNSELKGDKEGLENYTGGFEFTAEKILGESNIDPDKFFTKNGKTCNLLESIATIYPTSPYKAKDYKIYIDVVC